MNNQHYFYNLLKEFRGAEDKNETFEKFFMLFTPLLEKYAYKLGNKDEKYILSEALYNALLKIPYELEHFKEDKYIIGYICQAIKSEYIKISKKEKFYTICTEYNDNINSPTSNKGLEYALLINSIKGTLNQKDWDFFNLKFLEGYSDYEISRMYNISRQAANKRLKNIRNKIIHDITD